MNIVNDESITFVVCATISVSFQHAVSMLWCCLTFWMITLLFPIWKKKTRNEHKKEFEIFFAAVAVAFVRGPMQKRMREAQHIIFALFMHVHWMFILWKTKKIIIQVKKHCQEKYFIEGNMLHAFFLLDIHIPWNRLWMYYR